MKDGMTSDDMVYVQYNDTGGTKCHKAEEVIRDDRAIDVRLRYSIINEVTSWRRFRNKIVLQ